MDCLVHLLLMERERERDREREKKRERERHGDRERGALFSLPHTLPHTSSCVSTGDTHTLSLFPPFFSISLYLYL